MLTPVASLTLRIVPIARAARMAQGILTAPAGSGRPGPERIAALVRFAVSRLGGRCLTQAVVLHAILARRGIGSQVFIGAARIDGSFRAHAWLKADGSVLIGDGVPEYTPLLILGAQ